jgi:hypothetical protein
VELEMPEIPETLDREQVILELGALAAAGALWQSTYAAAVLIMPTEKTVAVAVLVVLAQTQEALVVSILTPVRPP